MTVGEGGHSMAAAAFNCDCDGIRIGDGEAEMVIDTSSGGWQWWASAFDGGNGQRWVLDSWQWQLMAAVAAVENRGGGGDGWWCPLVAAAFDSV